MPTTHVKTHYISLTRPELVRATIRGLKTETRRVITEQNSVLKGVTRYCKWESGQLIGFKESWGIQEISKKFPGRLQIVYRAGVDDIGHPEGNTADFQWRDVDEDTWRRYASKNQWRGPRFMPAWAIRLWAQVVSVRPERVQEIISWDCVAEGIPKDYYNRTFSLRTNKPNRMLIDEFQMLWDSINAARGYSWETNPWVWVLKFKLLTSTGLQAVKL